jgi:hypothetical protein
MAVDTHIRPCLTRVEQLLFPYSHNRLKQWQSLMNAVDCLSNYDWCLLLLLTLRSSRSFGSQTSARSISIVQHLFDLFSSADAVSPWGKVEGRLYFWRGDQPFLLRVSVRYGITVDFRTEECGASLVTLLLCYLALLEVGIYVLCAYMIIVRMPVSMVLCYSMYASLYVCMDYLLHILCTFVAPEPSLASSASPAMPTGLPFLLPKAED